MPSDTQGQGPARTPAFPIAIPKRLALFAIWLVTTVIGTFFAMLNKDSALVDGTYLPRTNDSFYHARRILDAISSGGLPLQFDTRLHVPEGTWVPWPWGYDYLMAQATRLAQWLWPTLDSMAFLSHVPVAWVGVNAALFLAGASVLGLSMNLRVLAMLCFALSPLTMLLHSIGMLDHHFMELTFVLLTIWLGLRWFERPDSSARAAWLGAALGISQAFHNGLFLLQLPIIVTALILWLRRSEPAKAPLTALGIALLLTTHSVLAPSATFQAGIFEFGLLSWFHSYVAFATTLVMLYMARHRRTGRHLIGLGLVGTLLAAPLVIQLVSGAMFLSGRFSVLENIVEAASPYRLATQILGLWETLSWYSALLLVVPALLAYFGIRVFLERDRKQVFFAVMTVFGLTLLLTQFRFHVFGSFLLVAGSLLVVDRLRQRLGLHAGMVFLATFAAIAIAYQPSLRDRLFLLYPVSGDQRYESSVSLYRALEKACAEDPGIVLVHHDDGNAILYHTECSVFSNNFILRPQDDAKIREMYRLMRLAPEDMRRYQPEIKYALLRTAGYSTTGDEQGIGAEELTAQRLLLADVPPEGFTLIWTSQTWFDPDKEPEISAKLYKITR